jgi:hypothetical protein
MGSWPATEGTAATIERIDVFGYELTYAHGDYVIHGTVAWR